MRILVKALAGTLVIAVVVVTLPVLAQQAFKAPAKSPHGRDISWAFQETDGVMPREPGETPHTVPGSSRTYTRSQIDDLLNPPDWFPNEHAPAPAIVVKGHGAASACAACHLMSGFGHPESADLTGLPIEYFLRTTKEFRSGERLEVNHMNAIARELSDAEIDQAANWFATLKPTRWTYVQEASVVPKTWVPRGRMRLVRPEGGTEPLGDRIITLPRDPEGFQTRNPHTGFVAYVPVGSVKRGETLVATGGSGKTSACARCHGATLSGARAVPRLAGLHPAYIVRQLYLYKDGRRSGALAATMQKSVAELNDDDIIDIAAYLASLDPTNIPAGKDVH